MSDASPGDAPTPAEDALVRVGEAFGDTVLLSRDEVVDFATRVRDRNPMHHDEAAARASRFGGLIASGPQVASIMMGLFATHFTRRDDGVARAALGMDFQIRFKAPVRPDEEVAIRWEVVRREWKPRLRAWVAEGEASARSARDGVVIEMRGVGLVMPADRI